MLALTLFTSPTPTPPEPESHMGYDPEQQITVRPEGHAWPITLSHLDRAPDEKDDWVAALW
ncbi:hypothetical protein [Streptomyces sp. NPDC055094]